MKNRKYSSSGRARAKKEPMVKESSSSRYARQVSRKSSLRIGISLAEAKRRLKTPVKRSKRDIEWALGIVGIGEGPEDLSENMRAYLQREK
ncbi:MAG: hypothetical protein HYU47_11335 [Deltaproteobacteria bacterium]|nr:hypothetical protein [Deltaproteobacteria bacterium]